MKSLLLVLAFAVACVAQTKSTFWGGEHVRMETNAKGATLEFDCASGTLDEALPEKDGTQRMKGTYLREHGGPVRRDDAGAAPVEYTVTRRGNRMTLAVNGETYTLTQGQSGKVMKCK